MQVRQINTRRAQDVEKFVRFPLALYRDCPQWAPPLLATMRRSLDRARHPFYAHSEADFFVVESADVVLGRIGVLNNQSYNRYHQRRTGFFCYFDVVDDPSAARALFDAAFDWMRAHGLNEAFGPHALLKLDRGGVLVDGFAHRAAMGIAYNHAYYDRFLRDAGFVKEFDLLSGRLDEGHHLSERIREISENAKARYGFHVKTFATKKELRAWTPRIATAYEQAYRDFALYYPRTDAERALIADEMLSVADPSLMKVVLHGDEIAGFLFAFPDLADGLRRAGGELWPLGWWHLRRAWRQREWCDITHVGLLPEFRGHGASFVLYTELEPTLYSHGYRHADVQLIQEDNRLSLADMEAIGVAWYKLHRVYRRAL
jgi:GNAT superfamily N-acetyltransferase